MDKTIPIDHTLSQSPPSPRFPPRLKSACGRPLHIKIF